MPYDGALSLDNSNLIVMTSGHWAELDSHMIVSFRETFTSELEVTLYTSGRTMNIALRDYEGSSIFHAPRIDHNGDW